jgi:hypothetical protein
MIARDKNEMIVKFLHILSNTQTQCGYYEGHAKLYFSSPIPPKLQALELLPRYNILIHKSYTIQKRLFLQAIFTSKISQIWQNELC